MYKDKVADTFSAPIGSQEFTILSALAGIHKTAREKNLELFELVKSKGVQFNQIKRHLHNEAKRIGLWNGSFKESYYQHKAWYVQVENFSKWVSTNYTSYDNAKVKETKAIKDTKSARQIVVRKEVVIPKGFASNLSNPAAPTKGDIGVEHKAPSSNPEGRTDAITNTASNPASSLVAPVVQELSVIQIQQIVFQNLDVLAERAKALDATVEWNALMSKMGLEENLIKTELNFTSLLQKVEQHRLQATN